jgi:hypothetical protein
MSTLSAALLSGFLGLTFSMIEPLKTLVHKDYWEMLVFFVFFGVAISFLHQILLRNFTKENLAQYLLGITVLRILVCGIYAAIIIYLGIENKLIWVANFFILYILFLVFELISVVANLRAN